MTREQAETQFKAGNPGTAAFKAMGYPFEAFLRWAGLSDEAKKKLVEAFNQGVR